MRNAFFALMSFAGWNLNAAAVDPALAGFWSLDTPGAQLVWQIDAGGHYRMWGSFNDSGSIEAANGKWTTVSPLTMRQSGTYSAAPASLSTVGPTGAAHWRRETGAILDGSLVPRDLRKLVQGRLEILKRTAPDAALIMLEVKAPAPLAHPIELRFYSKKTNHVYVSGDGPLLDLGAPSVQELPVAADFIDLPEAIATARSGGMKGVFGRALLWTVTPPHGAPRTVWQITPAVWDGQLARSVDARSGRALDTASLTPLTGTDDEIRAAANRINGNGQMGAKEEAGSRSGGTLAGSAGGNASLEACGADVIVDAYAFNTFDPVKIPMIQVRLMNYDRTNDPFLYIPRRALTKDEIDGLTGIGYTPFSRITLPFPPGVAFYHEAFSVGQAAIDRVRQIQTSGCK